MYVMTSQCETFAQYKCRTFQSVIYPADKNNLIGISIILAWGKSRVGLPPPFIALLFEQKKKKPGLSEDRPSNNCSL